MGCSLPTPVRSAIDIWLGHHDRLAPGLIEGLYLVGSVALDDWHAGSDVDIIAVTADPATESDAQLLRAAHEESVAEIAIAIDGPRVAWGDLSVPPLPLHRPWTLDGVFHHDAVCFEINPITWHTLARHGVPIRGEPPARLAVATDIEDRRRFVRANVATYWRSVCDQLAAALDDPMRSEFPAETVEWCALGVARMLYTDRTGDVAAKSTAGEWAADALPGHAEVLRTAVRLRTTLDPLPVGRVVLEALHSLVDDVVRTITT